MVPLVSLYINHKSLLLRCAKNWQQEHPLGTVSDGAKNST